MTQYSSSFSYKVRAWDSVLETMKERYPSVLSLFTTGKPVESNTFIYYDDLDQPVTALVNGALSATGTTVTIDGEAGGTIAIGDTIAFRDKNTETRLVANRVGADLTVAALTYDHDDDVPIIRVATPKVEGTSLSAEDIRQGAPRTNYTQIFRLDIQVAGTKLKIDDEDFNTDVMSRGIAQKWLKLYRDLAMTCLYGIPVVSVSNTTSGQTAGMSYWLSHASAMKYDKLGAVLIPGMLNDANEQAYIKGSDPDVYLVSTATARKISAFNSSTTNHLVFITAGDDVGGGVRQVSRFTGDLTGTGTKKVLVDPNMPDGQIYLLSSSELSLHPLNDRAFAGEDSTPKGFDGLAYTILGEYGTKIRNPFYSHAMIYNFI